LKQVPVEPGTVIVHFDDCYQDVYTHAAPLLSSANLPVAAFVSSGFVNIDRAFAHDQEKYPNL
jgi:peptidoglycan/xylan/chitin deacetylase (PgdA/CDA1 family)